MVHCIGDLRSTNFFQMLVLGRPLTFLRQGQICAPYISMGKVLKSIFSKCIKTNGGNLQCIIKVVKCFSYKLLSPWGYLPLPLGFIHV